MLTNDVNERIKIYKKVFKYMQRVKSSFFSVCIYKIVLIPLVMLGPVLFKIFIDDVLAKRRTEMLKWVCLGYIVAFLAKLFIDMLLTKSSQRLKNRFTFDLRKDIWSIYLKIPFWEYEKMDPGDIKMRVDDDITSIANTISEQIIDYLFNFLFVVIYLIAVLVIDWRLTMLLLITIPLAYSMGLLIGRGIRNVNENTRVTESEYGTWQNECFQMWKDVRAQNIEKKQFIKFIKYRHKLALLGVRWMFFWYLGTLLYKLKNDIFTKLILYFVGGLFILKGSLTVGILILFIQYFSSVFENIDSINQKNIQLKANMPAIERINEILDINNEIKSEFYTKVNNFKYMNVDDISFKYDNSEDLVLRNISFKIEKGDYIAVVGKSGCGKTTLIKLLLNLYKPQNGKIFLNDININSIDEKCLYSYIGAVMQDCYLYNMSIRENLLLAKPNASLNQLEAACKHADIFNFISELPDKLETVIGEKGIKLSGGQKQRLVIAQILLKDPQIIIFDEATSSLDYQSEQIINKAIMELTKDRTILVVAHRLSSILGARKVIVMDEGKIIDVGSHTELMERCDEYIKLFKTQYNLKEHILIS